MTQKEWADDLMHYIGNDFDFHLKKIHYINNFELGQISVDANGIDLDIRLSEVPEHFDRKVYVVKFNAYCLRASNDYQNLDRENMKNLSDNQALLRARLRVQSAILKIYQEKDAHKKNQVGRNIIYIEFSTGGNLIWK